MIKKHTLLSCLILLVSVGTLFAKGKIEPGIYKHADKQRMQQWVDSVYNSMTQDEKIGQLIIIHVTGDNTDANKRRINNLVQNVYAGGILFSKGTPTDQAELTNLGQSGAKIPLLVTADAEWGLSMRLSNTTRFPKNMMIGAIRDDSLIYRYGLEMARQCRLMGIHVNFAPDIDVNSNPDNPVIGIRSFGEDSDKVAEWGIVYAKGVEDGGVLPVAKHFPGHGDTSTDSHYTLPLITHDKNRLNEVELSPFKKYIKEGLSSIMIAHLDIPALDDSGAPSSLSKPIITDLLKNNLGFRGLIFTDGLAMQGVAKEKDMSLRAILAGNDMLLGPSSPEKEFKALQAAVADGSLSMDVVEDRCKRILEYKYLLGLNGYKPSNVDNLINRLNTPYAEWLCRKLNEQAITLLRNDDKVIPLKNLDKRKIAAVALGETPDNSFQNTLKLYGDVTCFTASGTSDIADIKKQLEGFNTVIVSVHTTGTFSGAAVDSLIEGKESIVTFLVSPYLMSKYASSVKSTNGLIMAYENTPFAQEYAAQAIFGGNAIRGKLPVSVSGLFDVGDGMKTSKVRLSYNVPEEVGIRSYKLQKIEDIVREGLAAHAYPGCEVLVAKDGVVIYNKAFGSFEYDNKRPVLTSDIYDLASMTKAAATVPAVMKLYDDKKLLLQTPLSDYVKQLRHTDKDKITIRQALFHETGLTSFIPYYLPAIDQDSYSGQLIVYRQTDGYPALIDNGAWARTDFKFKPELISQISKPGFTKQIADNLYVSDSYKDIMLQNIADSKLRSKKSYLYSCLNFILLKEAVEKTAGTDLNTFLQNNFYSKLGAVTTTYNPLTKFDKSIIAPTEQDDFLRKQLLQGYVHDEGAAFLGGISGNAGLFSNANDLAKLFQMWLDQGTYGDEKYLSKETVRMFTMTKSPNSRRGLGFDKPDMQNTKSSPTSPSTPASVYGHTGFTGTCFWVDPDNDLIYIFLSNRVNPSRTSKDLMKLNIRPRIQEVIYNAIK